ncbi:MAG: hypothetical protein EOM55_02515 [Clostridia bacterium]|nr:hypothetical protein [Clostridia bacterium]
MKKSEFVENILAIIKKYPQEDEKGIIYSFAGSIGLMLLGLCDKKLVSKCHVVEGKIKILYHYKISLLFSKFYRNPTDYDIEVYRHEVYNLGKTKKRQEVEGKEIFLDCFNCDISKIEKTIYFIYLNGQKVYIEDFKKNLGFKLMTYANLTPERFEIKKEIYIKKYKNDFSVLLKIFFKYFGIERTRYHIMSNFCLKEESQKAIFTERIKLLKLQKKYSDFLLGLFGENK